MNERLGQHSQAAAKKLQVKSALNPLLWLTAISAPIFISGAYFFRDHNVVLGFLILGAVLPVTFSCLGFVYFAIYKPEKLQSEDYQIRHESLRLIQQKSGQLETAVSSLDQIVNPSLANEKGKGDNK